MDVAAPSYGPADNQGITYEQVWEVWEVWMLPQHPTYPPYPPILFPDQAMRRIHAITADGRIVSGVEVFRLLYQAVGLGWVYAITRCGICVRRVLTVVP